MTVTNVHERVLAAPLDDCAPLIDRLASSDDLLWPVRDWPAMRFAPGLEVGAPGGHGPIRYYVEELDPGRWVRFRFTGPDGFDGYHEFTLQGLGTLRTLIRHTARFRPRRTARLSWPLVFRPLHDALIEDALDKAQSWVSQTEPPTPSWSAYVQRLRALAPQRLKTRVPSRAGRVVGGPTSARLLPGGLLSIAPTYVDRFTLTTDVEAPARDWAKAMFEEFIKRSDRELVFGRLLGLAIGPDGDLDAVSGWQIEVEEPQRIRVAARGRGVRANLLLETRPGSVTMTLGLELRSVARGAVWRVVSMVHRREAAPTLRGGAALLSERRSVHPGSSANKQEEVS